MHIYDNKGHNSLHVELLLVLSLEVPLGLRVGSLCVFVVVLGLNIDPFKFGKIWCTFSGTKGIIVYM